MSDDTYPDSWALRLATREQRAIIGRFGGTCQFNFAGCTQRATTTRSAVPGTPVNDQLASCQHCADQ